LVSIESSTWVLRNRFEYKLDSNAEFLNVLENALIRGVLFRDGLLSLDFGIMSSGAP
jgi:hypothetical protein